MSLLPRWVRRRSPLINPGHEAPDIDTRQIVRKNYVLYSYSAYCNSGDLLPWYSGSTKSVETICEIHWV